MKSFNKERKVSVRLRREEWIIFPSKEWFTAWKCDAAMKVYCMEV